MTRHRDIMCEDISGCDHRPETPVADDDGNVIAWLCRCGRRAIVRRAEAQAAHEARRVHASRLAAAERAAGVAGLEWAVARDEADERDSEWRVGDAEDEDRHEAREAEVAAEDAFWAAVRALAALQALEDVEVK